MKYKIEHEIPEGYEARIEGNKVIITKKESEDERIRKFLIDYFKSIKSTLSDGVWKGFQIEEILAWLEERRQAWTEEDEEFVDYVLPRILEPDRWTLEQRAADRKRLEEFINSFRDRYMSVQKTAEWSEDDLKWAEEIRIALQFYSKDKPFVEKLTNWFDNHIQPKPAEWSEEDKKILDELLDHCNTENATWYNWLKSRCPHLTQKENKEETDSRPFSDFVNKYCLNCGSQRCTHEGEWLDGCPLYRAWLGISM